MKKFNDFFAAVFCINLKKRPQRLESAKAEFEKHGITVEFIEAVDGKELDDLDGFSENLVSADGQKVTRGDLGCTLSHLKVAQIAKERNLANYFVFEDDVELVDDFNEKFAAYIQQVPGDWYMLYLGANHDSGYHLVTPNLVQMIKSFTTHAMGVNNTNFDAVIDMLSLKNDKVDILLSVLHGRGKKCFCFLPNLAMQKPGYSDILEKQVDYKHLRNTGNGGNGIRVYVPLNVLAQTILQKHFDFDLNVDLVNDDLQQVLAAVNNPDTSLKQLFDSDTSIIFVSASYTLRKADAINYNAIKDALVARVKGDCIFVSINFLNFEYAEIKPGHFESNINIVLHNESFDAFVLDASRRLIGFEHLKKFFPSFRHNNIKEENQVFRNGEINTTDDLFYKLKKGFTDYGHLLLEENIDIVTPQNVKSDISVVIPVNGRLEYNGIVCAYLNNAVDYYNKRHPAAYNIKVGIIIVEHSEKPLHREACAASGVNYAFIPQDGKPFNKSLAQNAGAIILQHTKNYLFHDVDLLVPNDFFFGVFNNVNAGLYDAVQCFTNRRVLLCDNIITPLIMEQASKGLYVEPFHFIERPNIAAADPGAPGGSMFMNKKAFLRVGGFNDVFFKEYSLEDLHFLEKLDIMVYLGFCDEPAIELLHLYHEPANDRSVNAGELNAYQQWAALTPELKKKFILAERQHIRKYISWEDFA